MIKNGKDNLLSQSSGTLPDVSGAMLNWFQKIIIGVVTKSVQNFLLVETVVDVAFNGVWQPMSAQKLMIKPEGQRQWKWFTIHSDIALPINNDDLVRFQSVNYRVMDKTDYSLYGYYEYNVVDNFSGDL